MIQIDMDMPKCCANCDMETYEENYNGDPTFHYCPMVYKGYTDEIRDRGRLNDCPVKEVKRGKWIPVRSYEAFGGDETMWEIRGNPVAFHYCSNCRNDAYAGEDGESLLTKYCPNCGARMKK